MTKSIYTPEILEKIKAQYLAGAKTEDIAAELNVTNRSVIAKLANEGVYVRKSYLNKRGETPVKKSEYIDRLAALLEVDASSLESLEKVNKSVLKLLETALK